MLMRMGVRLAGRLPPGVLVLLMLLVDVSVGALVGARSVAPHMDGSASRELAHPS